MFAKRVIVFIQNRIGADNYVDCDLTKSHYIYHLSLMELRSGKWADLFATYVVNFTNTIILDIAVFCICKNWKF